MTTRQEMIDHDIRQIIGDLQVQLIFARAQVLDLEQQLLAAAEEKPAAKKANGKSHEEKPGADGHDMG